MGDRAARACTRNTVGVVEHARAHKITKLQLILLIWVQCKAHLIFNQSIDGPHGIDPQVPNTATKEVTKYERNYNGYMYPLTCSQTLCCSRTKVVCSSLVHTQTFMQTRRCRCTR